MNLWTWLTVVAFFSIVPISNVHALGQDCLDNKIKDVGRPHIFISEWAILTSKNACPTIYDSALPIKFGNNELSKEIYVWLRIQGTEAYVRSLKRDPRFKIKVYQKSNVVERDRPLNLSSDRLRKSMALREATASESKGKFDWRIDANFTAYAIPGTYSVEVVLGNRRLCLIDGKCSLDFTVSK